MGHRDTLERSEKVKRKEVYVLIATPTQFALEQVSRWIAKFINSDLFAVEHYWNVMRGIFTLLQSTRWRAQVA